MANTQARVTFFCTRRLRLYICIWFCVAPFSWLAARAAGRWAPEELPPAPERGPYSAGPCPDTPGPGSVLPSVPRPRLVSTSCWCLCCCCSPLSAMAERRFGRPPRRQPAPMRSPSGLGAAGSEATRTVVGQPVASAQPCCRPQLPFRPFRVWHSGTRPALHQTAPSIRPPPRSDPPSASLGQGLAVAWPGPVIDRSCRPCLQLAPDPGQFDDPAGWARPDLRAAGLASARFGRAKCAQ